MEFNLLSGVVRNRKVVTQPYSEEVPGISVNSLNNNGENQSNLENSIYKRIGQIFHSMCGGSVFIRNFNLRIHKFKFKWDLLLHLCICLSSLSPFAFSGNRLFAIIPLSVWSFYNLIFLISTRYYR